ncbi:MAG: FMN-binding negative transcriptional regulator [Pseudomonadota bacterium]
MYVPKKFEVNDREALYALMRAYPLATVITGGDGLPEADHVPLHLVLRADGPSLQGHLAKANPVWQRCTDGTPVLAIFHGPNAYVSPNYYPSKQAGGKVVPTWNYSVVHVRGRMFLKHEADWVPQLFDGMTAEHEARQERPWRVADAPADFSAKLIEYVVGFEIEVDEMLGKFKLSQNANEADRAGAIAGLADSGEVGDLVVSQQMRAQHELESGAPETD